MAKYKAMTQPNRRIARVCRVARYINGYIRMRINYVN